MRLYGSFSKVDSEQRIVSGYASTETVDRAGEIVLRSAIEAALDDYLEFPSIRQMHQLHAVGKTIEAEVDDRGLYISAKIVDADAWQKVTEGVFRGFSIGGKTLARDPKNKKIITAARLDEISLVDRPANPQAVIDVIKATGLYNGDDVFSHDLAKVTRQRDSMAKQLADRDLALADLAARTELLVKTVTAIVAENSDYRKQIADLTKRLRAPPNSRSIDAVTIGKAATAIEDTVASLTARLDHLERGAGCLNTRNWSASLP